MYRWDRHALDHARAAAHMSKDPNTQVGAVIIGPDREIRTTGFNGMARGVRDTTERLNGDLKNTLIVHAETNAIYNAARIGVSVRGCTLYLLATDIFGNEWGGPPCINCAMAAIQAGISSIRSLPFKSGPSKWRDNTEIARDLLTEAGVGYSEIEK